MTLFEELSHRGLIAQMTHPEQIEALLNKGSGTFYMGFDATANSLHVGHFLVLTTIKRMHDGGAHPHYAVRYRDHHGGGSQRPNRHAANAHSRGD